MDIVWLGPIVNEATVLRAPAVSPAANRWQLSFVKGLYARGDRVQVLGYLPEPGWPKGRVRVPGYLASLPEGISGRSIGYWNFHWLRSWDRVREYRRSFPFLFEKNQEKRLIVTYNGSYAHNAAAREARERYCAPWVCVVADDEAPSGADGYVFLSWGYYKKFETSRSRLHLDGGIELKLDEAGPKPCSSISDGKRKVVMYTGSFGKHAGVECLVRAFHKMRRMDVDLWLCGKGTNCEVSRFARKDSRIKVFGMVSEARLLSLVRGADIFVNPRPSSVVGNDKNFPSKVLEYLSYGRPVVSTWTEGLSPEYRDVLFVPEDQTDQGLKVTLERVINMNAVERGERALRARRFAQGRTWEKQVARFADWTDGLYKAYAMVAKR